MHTHATPQNRPLAAFARPDAKTARSPLRAALERHVEACIAILDAIDGDPEIEPNGDERDCDLAGAMSDVEHDDSDREPSLGSFDRMANQENWSRARGVNCFLDIEECVPHGYRQVKQAMSVEIAATRCEIVRLDAVIARLRGDAAPKFGSCKP